MQAPAGRVARVHDEDRQAGREDPAEAIPTSQAAFSVEGFSFSGAAPNQRHDLHAAQAVRRAAGRGALAAAPCSAALRGPLMRHHRRDRRAVPAAGDPGPVGASAASSSRCSTRPAAPIADLADAPRGSWSAQRQPDAGAWSALFSQFTRQRSAAGGRHRSRRGAQPRPAAARGHRRAAGVPRVAVRQRLRLQQPRLSRLRAGRPAVPRAARRTSAALRARRRTAQMVPLDNVVTRAARPRRRRSSATSTCSARPRSTARAAPGVSSGQALQAMEQHRARDAAAGLRLRVGRPVARGDQGRVAGRPASSGSACCSSTWCWRRSTRAGCCRSSSCWRAAGGPRRAAARSGCAA